MGFVRDLDRVAEIPLEEVEAQGERDLKLIDEDEKEDIGAGIEVLPDNDRPNRQRVDRDRRLSGEERVGDRHHLAHQAKMRDAENDDDEQRRRQRQVARQLIVLVGVRPVAEPGDEVEDAEQHRLDGEEVGEEGQKGRLLPPRQRSERGQA